MTKAGPLNVNICPGCRTFDIRLDDSGKKKPDRAEAFSEVNVVELMQNLSETFNPNGGRKRLSGCVVYDTANRGFQSEGKDAATETVLFRFIFFLSRLCGPNF